MNISIFSKFTYVGGSEFRCVELANGLSKFTDHTVSLLCQNEKFPKQLSDILDKNVKLVTDSLSNPDVFYNSDAILIINSDSREFCTLDFWYGNSVSNYKYKIDLNKLAGKQMLFLFNFIISPSRNLFQFEKLGIKTSILCTNNKFFNEISTHDKFDFVRHIPRFIVRSPIDGNKIKYSKRNTDTVTFLSYSKPADSKWNNQLEEIVAFFDDKYKDSVKFRMMGVKPSLVEKLSKFTNCNIFPENHFTVQEFLLSGNVFLFMPDYRREEPWARVIAESMTSGLPIIAYNKGGTQDQVIHGNNGFLCKDYSDFLSAMMKLTEHKNLITSFGFNSMIYSKEFESQQVAKYINYIITSIHEN